MNTKRKLVIDSLIGIPTVFLLNLLAKTLGFFLRINHSFSDKKINHIVVCKFLGMGSIIQATPLLQTLKKNYPNAKIAFLTTSPNVALLNKIPQVNNILTVDDKSIFSLFSSSIKTLSFLIKNKSDVYIDLEIYSYYSTIMATLSCATNRIGYYRKESNIRLGVYTHMVYFNSKVPISQAYLQMARLIGCKEITEELLSFSIDEAEQKSMFEKLPPLQNGKYVVLNPNASDLRIERRWDAQSYSELTDTLSVKYPEYFFVLIGAKSEEGYVQKEVYEKIKSKQNVLSSAGKLSLYELLALIKNAALMITNDTGPMHMAFAFNLPTIALFGPCSPEQYGHQTNAYCVYKNVYCSPCVHEFQTPPCGGNNQCMKQIEVKEVALLADTILSTDEKRPAIKQNNQKIIFTDNILKTTLGMVERDKI